MRDLSESNGTRRNNNNECGQEEDVKREILERESITSMANDIQYAENAGNALEGGDLNGKEVKEDLESNVKVFNGASEKNGGDELDHGERQEEATSRTHELPLDSQNNNGIIDLQAQYPEKVDNLQSRSEDFADLEDSNPQQPLPTNTNCRHHAFKDGEEDSVQAPSVPLTAICHRNGIESAKEAINGQEISEIKENGINSELSTVDDQTVLATKIEPKTVHAKLENGKETSAHVESRNGSKRSRKDVVSMTFEERKQLIIEASNATPKKAKPAKSRRSILQIQNRNRGQLVSNKKGMYETKDSEPSVPKSINNRRFRFLQRKTKGPETTDDVRRVLPKVHEEINSDLTSDCQHQELSSSLSTPNIHLASITNTTEVPVVDSPKTQPFLSLPRKLVGLRRQLPKTPEEININSEANSRGSRNLTMSKSVPNLCEVDDDTGEESSGKESISSGGRKGRSPINLSPFRFKLRKKSGSYDLHKMQTKNDKE